MRVLVTGGAGFIGSHVVDAALKEGHEVAVVDDLRTGDHRRVNLSARFFEVDIRDIEALGRVFREFHPEVVSHQAAQSEVPLSVKEPMFDASVNVLGGLNLLQLCRSHGARKVVFASTAALYGDPTRVPCDETDAIQPLAPYGVSKAAFELYLSQFKRTFDLDYTVLRYANVYGSRQPAAATEGRVIAVFAHRMLKGDSVVIDGDGSQARDFVHADDVALANLAAFERGSGATLHVSSGIATSVRELFDRLATLTGYREEPIFGPARAGDVHVVALDPSRAAAELGWRLSIDIESGLARTVDELRASIGI